MLYGHNSNVTVGGTTYHVQTEDRGSTHALIDTTVYLQGRVLHRLTNNYLDLLPVDANREELLRKRVDQQHRNVVEALRSGVLHLTVPKLPAGEAAVQNRVRPPAPQSAPPSPMLDVELTNARNCLVGKRARLQISVRRKNQGGAVAAALVKARIEGAAEPASVSGDTGLDGNALLEFEMPRLAGPEVALIIDAVKNDARGQLRFHLRARPRAPAS